MAVTFLRTLIIITTLIILMRLMGKRQIGEMQPFEFIITLIIADLACVPMADVSIPLVYGIVGVVCLFLLHQLLTLLEQSGKFLKTVISGKPSLVINRDGVDLIELKKNNMGVDDLIETMRAQGYFSFDDVLYAIYESNGQLSAMANPDKAPTSSLPLLIVTEGKIDVKNLQLIKVDNKHFSNFLTSFNIDVKAVDILTIDGNGKVYLKEKNKKYKILNFNLQEGVSW